MCGEEPEISGHLIAGLQQYDVAGNQVFPFYRDTFSATNNMGLRSQHMANGIHGLFCLTLLDKTNDGVRNDHRQNDASIHPMTEQCGNNRGSNQYINQNIVKMQNETQQWMAAGRLW